MMMILLKYSFYIPPPSNTTNNNNNNLGVVLQSGSYIWNISVLYSTNSGNKY